MNKSGYIYALINASYPQFLKIGKTQRTAEERAKELSRQARTGIPSEYVVAYENEVSDCSLVESLVHKELAKYRWNKDKEFFKLSLKKAIIVIEKVISNLESQQKIEILQIEEKEFTFFQWWNELSFTWQQIFRRHLTLSYQPSEIDILRAIHSVIDYCQNENLRKKVSLLIADTKYLSQLTKWYNNLGREKELFNSYLPYELSENEIASLFNLTIIDCSNNTSVINLKPLEKMTKLISIIAYNTSISDLKPLSNHKKLENICLNYTEIYDLTPLESLNFLKTIECYQTNLTPAEIERFSKISNCKVINNSFLISDSFSH